MLNPTDSAKANNSNTPTFQPMRFGDILDMTFSLYRNHFLVFLGIIAPYFFGSRLVGYALSRFLPDFLLKDFVVDLVRVPFALVSMGGIIVATANIYLGEHITSRDALQQALHRFWYIVASHLPWSFAFQFTRIGIAFLLVNFVPEFGLMLILMPFISLVFIPFWIDVPMGWWYDFIKFVIRPGWLWLQFIPSVLVPFSIYFAARWMFVPAAVLLEKPLIRYAFGRSRELTRRKWWRAWGMLISFAVLSFVIQRILEITVGFILALTKLAGAITPMDIIRAMVMYEPVDISNSLYYVIMDCTGLVVGTLIFPIWVIGITLLYFDLRMRKEEDISPPSRE